MTRRGSKVMLIRSNIVLAFGTALTLMLVAMALTDSYVSSMTLFANYFPVCIRNHLLSVSMSMFSAALLMAGTIGIATGEAHWRLLLSVAAALPIIVILLTQAFILSEGSYTIYGGSDIQQTVAPSPNRWRGIFVGSCRAVTLCYTALAGLNFSSYQFYSEFITTCLLNERHFEATTQAGSGWMGWERCWDASCGEHREPLRPVRRCNCIRLYDRVRHTIPEPAYPQTVINPERVWLRSLFVGYQLLGGLLCRIIPGETATDKIFPIL